MKTVTPNETWRAVSSGHGRLVDVREPGEFGGVRAVGSLNFPLSTLEDRIDEIPGGDPLYILCAAGSRAIAAAKILSDGGRGANVVVGGMSEWRRAGLPTETGNRRTISMERQVRLCAGLLILLGLGMGRFVHDGFYFLSAGVGAGLVFSGATGFCGLAKLLARCPWNR